jgi:hypothetical protein
MCLHKNDCGFAGVTGAECLACDPKGPDPDRCRRVGCCYGDGQGTSIAPSCFFAADPCASFQSVPNGSKGVCV